MQQFLIDPISLFFSLLGIFIATISIYKQFYAYQGLIIH